MRVSLVRHLPKPSPDCPAGLLLQSVAGLVRHVASGNPAALAGFEEALFPAFQHVLQQDVQVGRWWEDKGVSLSVALEETALLVTWV